MKPYAPPTNIGRTRCVDDIHHRTADQPRGSAKASAKACRHSARHAAKLGVMATPQTDGNRDLSQQGV